MVGINGCSSDIVHVSLAVGSRRGVKREIALLKERRTWRAGEKGELATEVGVVFCW